jgi:hypothetical protein
MSPFYKPYWLSLGYAAVCMVLLDASAALAETTLEKIKRMGVVTSATRSPIPPSVFDLESVVTAESKVASAEHLFQ